MKRSYILFSLLFWVTAAFAQPSNDNCLGAISIAPNGPCILNGTTVGATDSWSGSVGCQGGGNHPDVWYSFIATGTQAHFTVTTSAPWTGNVELILFEGSCSLGFFVTGYDCGTSILNTTINGLQPGANYFFIIANSNSGIEGPFNVCLTNTTPPPLPGQDCDMNAAILCNSNTFTQSASTAGFGTQEVSPGNSCWGTLSGVPQGERQSKWFKFTVGCSGTLEFNIKPNNLSNDYDWALWNISSDPNNCTTKGNSIACNWTGCTGSTGLSSCVASEPGATTCGGPGDVCLNGNSYRGWGNWAAGLTSCNAPSGGLAVTAGNTYALLVDNFTASNSGFTLTFGGACGGGTATIGPDANFTYTVGACGTYTFHKTCHIVPATNSTYLWQFGDGQTSNAQDPIYTYSTFGSFVISLQVKDALGCVTTSSQTINIVATTVLVNSPTICAGQNATLTANPSAGGGTYLWSPGGATSSSITVSPASTNTYTVTYTLGGCSNTGSGTVTVNPILSPTVNCGVSTASSVNFTWAGVSGATGYSISYQVNGGAVNNIGAIGNVLSYQVTGLAAGDNVSITVTPTGAAGSCFNTATTSCTATACTPPTATINYGGPFCANDPATYSVTLTGTGTGGTFSALPGLTLNSVTGDIVPSTSTPGTYTVTYTVAPAGGCPGVTATKSVTINTVITPTFNPVTAICSGAALAALPPTSTNGINGTWSPALDNTATKTYTFTPSAGQCATTTTLMITVNPNIAPTFNAVAPICSGAALAALPPTSTNGINGSWSPALNNTATTTYTFTPTAGQCATTATLMITVNPNIAPTFNAVAPICSGAALAALPPTSTNGINGSWSPALNNTATITYTFTPTAGQCATTTTLMITVNPNIAPTFNAVAPICSGAALAALPTTSTNGINGSWSPALNNTATITYTFTPTAGQCATTTTLMITVNPILSPTINCGVSTTTSVSFNWAAVSGATGYSISYQVNGGAVNNIGAIGNVLTYQVTGLTGGDNVSITVTPTGAAGSCFNAATTSCTATACTPPTAAISYGGPFCANDPAIYPVTLTGTGTGGTFSALPALTLNSATGDITPATSTPGTYTVIYTVAPSGGCPGVTATTSVTINTVITPTFNPVTPICSGVALAVLPPTSTNGINGSWSPALNNTATTTYTFTPTAGQCATTTTLMITVNPNIAPTFNAVAPICSGAALAALPTTSTNGINGSWSPALNNTATITYTFTPTAGQCATTTILMITVNPGTTPTFNAVAPICSGAALATLPTTSTNGINGSWSPALNNTATTTYTFTPTAGQCATTTTLTITVNPILSPTINCGVSTTSFVSFTWAAVSGATDYTVSYQVNGGAVNNIGAIGNVLSYQVNGLTGGDNVSITVTPTGAAGSCFNAATASCTATACTPPTASISYATPFCANDPATHSVTLNGTGTFTGGTFSALPALTLNSVTGDIVPATSTPGTYTVTYTVAPVGGCPGVTATKSVTINTVITPTFNAVAPICSGAALAALPTTSTNGINGSWSPALNNTATTTYTFTPTAGQCATTTTLMITVNPGITPTFNAVAPICSGTVLVALPTTSTNGINGTWSPALNNMATTTYTFTPTAGQCATTTTLVVTVSAAPNLKINDPPAICEPAIVDLSQASITTGSDPGLSYSYWTNATATASLASPSVNASGTYYIKGSSAAGCTAVKPVQVTIEKKIKGTRYPDVTASPNTPVQLQARSIGTNDNYIWSPALGLNSSKISNPIFSYDKETEYHIDISTQAGCVTVDTLQVLFNVAAPAPASNVFVPKAWTPNGDGHNDNLIPLMLNISSIKYFRIFNRWGQLVFETNTIGKGWDGKYRGISQPIDTYTWIVEAVSATGEKITRTGGSVLLR